MGTLHAEIHDGDPAILLRNAHTLKGSANLFYAKKVCDAASVFERSVQEQDAIAADRLLVLDQEVELMKRALVNFLEITAE